MNSVHYISAMPKLIPQLEKQIIDTAEKMFIAEGFEIVSMRKIAGELNIAVGTLYNYFPNKTALFFSIMERSWNKTFNTLENICSKCINPGKASRRKAIEAIYDGIRGRGCFALKTFGTLDEKKSSKSDRHTPSFNNEELIKKLENALKPLGAGFAAPDSERLIKMLLATIRMYTFQSVSDSRDKDIDFLLKIVELT